MAVSTTIRSFAPAFNSGKYGWINIALASTAGVSAAPRLLIAGDLEVIPYQELPNLSYKCRIINVPPQYNGGRLIVRGGDTVVDVPAPSLSTLTPNTAVHGAGNTSVTIAGTGFVSGATLSFGNSLYQTTFGSATSLTVTILAADLAVAGSKSAVVTNPDGQSSNSLTFTIT